MGVTAQDTGLQDDTASGPHTSPPPLGPLGHDGIATERPAHLRPYLLKKRFLGNAKDREGANVTPKLSSSDACGYTKCKHSPTQ